MSKLVYTALALTLVSTQGIASENEWSSLDQEIANLSASLSSQGTTAPKISGWLKVNYLNSGDDAKTTASGNDEGGFRLDSARIEVTGDAGSDYGYKLSFDLSDGDSEAGDSKFIDPGSARAALKDAYATWKMGDTVMGKLGRFKSPFLRSGNLSDAKLFFLQRTVLGESFDVRDMGIAFSGNFDNVRWVVAAQNGADVMGDDLLLTARVEADLMGAGAGKVEGAYGAPAETALTVGAAYQNDDFIDDSTAMGFDAMLTHAAFSVHGEMVDLDDGIGDATPWALTGTYMFNDMWEAGVRYEDFDDSDDTNLMTAGVNRYIQGHDIKWTAQWLSLSSDVSAAEFDEIGIGLTVSF